MTKCKKNGQVATNPSSQPLSSVPSAIAPAAGAKVEALLSATGQAKAEAKEEIVHNRVQSCIIVHNRAISWVKPSWMPDSASSPLFLPSPVIQGGGWPRRSPPRHPHELALVRAEGAGQNPSPGDICPGNVYVSCPRVLSLPACGERAGERGSHPLQIPGRKNFVPHLRAEGRHEIAGRHHDAEIH